MAKQWILASSSPRRIELLRTVISDFDICSASVEELHEVPNGNKPEVVAQINARKKAEYVAQKNPNVYVVGADTIVALGNAIFNKPQNLKEARWMLEQLAEHTHDVITAVCVICKSDHFCREFSAHSPVTFAKLDSKFIEDYLQKIHPLDKAGAYAIQHPLTKTFATFSPKDYTNIMGFPVDMFEQVLKNAHYM